MSRPYKLNETPTAPFSLRELGPLTLADVAKRLRGSSYRTARGANPDTRATVDPSPCPHCNALVEWSTTAKRGAKGETVRYVYARCRGSKQHRWSFAGAQAEPTPPQAELHRHLTDAIPPPRPSAGAHAMGDWIANRIQMLSSELDKLKTIERLAQEVTGRSLTVPRPIQSPVPMPSSGAPDHTPPSGFRS